MIGLLALFQVLNDIDDRSDQEQRCANKYCSEIKSTMDERWTRRKYKGKISLFCQKCTQAFKQKQYCEFCKQIYLDKSANNAIVDGEDWIQCETCKRWAHIKCEANEGNSDIGVLILDPLFHYYCKECKKANISVRKNIKKRVNDS